MFKNKIFQFFSFHFSRQCSWTAFGFFSYSHKTPKVFLNTFNATTIFTMSSRIPHFDSTNESPALQYKLNELACCVHWYYVKIKLMFCYF